MRVLLALGVVVLLGMQVRLWFSDIGVLARLNCANALPTRHTAELGERNRRLAIARRSRALPGVQTRARSELGMIERRTFYIVLTHNRERCAAAAYPPLPSAGVVRRCPEDFASRKSQRSHRRREHLLLPIEKAA
jgi:hypothetical protein